MDPKYLKNREKFNSMENLEFFIETLFGCKYVIDKNRPPKEGKRFSYYFVYEYSGVIHGKSVIKTLSKSYVRDALEESNFDQIKQSAELLQSQYGLHFEHPNLMRTLGIDAVPFEISEDFGGELKIPFIRMLEMDGSFEDLFNYQSNSEFTQGLKVWYIFLILKGLEYLYLNGVKAYGCLTPRKILYRKPSEGF